MFDCLIDFDDDMKLSKRNNHAAVSSGSFRMLMMVLLFSWLCALILLHNTACFEGAASQTAQDASSQAASLASSFSYSSKSSPGSIAAAAVPPPRTLLRSPSINATTPMATETVTRTETLTRVRVTAPTIASALSTTIDTDSNLVPPPIAPFHVDPFFAQQHEVIDSKGEEQRCAAFGVPPLHHSVPHRRLFFGSMLADENMDVLKIHALEAYNIYHTVAFVESNTSHSGAPRTMRFRDTMEERLLREANYFGGKTNVVLDYWLEDMPGLKGMDREVEQRAPIAALWKQAGMTEHDVAVMADVDEILSRDFLRALQVCDFPELRQEKEPSCQRPKLALNTLVFEASPFCISKRGWFHPDVILGQCVDGIGDATERIAPKRSYQRQYGGRTAEYGFYDPEQYPKHVLDSGRFPLWSSRDIREIVGSHGLTEYKNTDTSNVLLASVAYHLHNWFDDLAVLRNKYATYGHYDEDWANNGVTKELSKLNRELDLVVRCTRDLGNDLGEDEYYEKDVLEKREYHRPIFFMNETYQAERHDLIQELVRKDEAEFGSGYNIDGTEVASQQQESRGDETKQDSPKTPDKQEQPNAPPPEQHKSSTTTSELPQTPKVALRRSKLAPQTFKVR